MPGQPEQAGGNSCNPYGLTRKQEQNLGQHRLGGWAAPMEPLGSWGKAGGNAGNFEAIMEELGKAKGKAGATFVTVSWGQNWEPNWGQR